ncbi:putative pentatricopeptide repeat-containing protein At1g10330 [Oryza glaberrima]|uniref:Pentacotripeptide-repeat region of PRORP domain-containing protein n=1 Tax=Oryza glaberrima TaxID=4538 RepID=I1PTY1_ORYGL|nr:putative pentatricopeptide repeat-containing protein At1g10330 [Oryza glaberrima]
MIARSRHAASLAAAACGGTSSAARSYAGLDLLLQENFSAPRRVLQLHALLLTSGALSLPHPHPAATAAFPYNCLIHAHLRLRGSASPPWGPLRIFSAMLARGVRPNRHTFPSLLKSSASFDAATPTLHAQCLRRGLDEDRFVACSLLSAYGRDDHLVRDARKVFDDMASPDLATCNAMLDVLCLSGDMYGARCLFDRMVVRDVVSWTTIISGLTRIGCHWDAVEMFRAFLLQNKGRLSEATLVSVLSACANLDAVEGLAVGMAVHGHVVRHEVQFTAFLGTALIDMYGKYGKLSCCSHIFHLVRDKEVCTWNALLSALANHGKEAEALVKFEMMRSEGFLPNHITFVAVMTACARAGLVETGLDFFEELFTEYKVIPMMVHYGCVVDLLGRAGRFLEAIQIIERMPFMADDSVWGALLGACKIHGNIELSAQIREKLIVLGGQQPGRYVTVRNMYLEEGNWYAATRMGEVMQEAGIKKIVGMSSVVLN